MTQMNLFTNHRQNHSRENKLMVPKGVRGGRDKVEVWD